MAKTKLYTFYMSLYGAPTKHVVKMASLVVTCMPSSNLKRDRPAVPGRVRFQKWMIIGAQHSSTFG